MLRPGISLLVFHTQTCRAPFEPMSTLGMVDLSQIKFTCWFGADHYPALTCLELQSRADGNQLCHVLAASSSNSSSVDYSPRRPGASFARDILHLLTWGPPSPSSPASERAERTCESCMSRQSSTRRSSYACSAFVFPRVFALKSSIHPGKDSSSTTPHLYRLSVHWQRGDGDCE